MAGISASGLGSGLDINSIVSQLMAVEQQPLTVLATKEASYQAKLSAFGSLKGALSSLQTAAQSLKNASTFTAKSASTADSTVATASAGTTATAGTYDIAITTLAKAKSVNTTDTSFTATDTFEAGSIAFTIGTTTKTVTLEAGKTVAQIATAINDAKIGISASVVDNTKLVLTSGTTGTTGSFTYVATTTNDGNPTSKALTLLNANAPLQTAVDAAFSVNGIAMTRSSNSVTDAVSGVTLNLLKEAGATTRLTVTNNTGTISSAVNAFVKAYNDAVNGIKQMTAYDATNQQSSVLTGDSTARSIQSKLGSLVSSSVSGIAGGISRLTDIGVTVQKDGTLAVDSSKLSAAVANPDIDVKSFFTQTTSGNEGIAVRFNSLLEGIVGSSGLIASRTEGINASIKDLEKRAEALNLRLESIEKRYRTQFTALDTLVSSMNQTSEYLSQQLANLPSASSRKN